jgi:hypothetical protein
MFYVTWQPEVAEAGHYFVTFVKAEPDASVADIMALAHELEDLEMDSYDLCSIFYVKPECHKETTVIY